MTPSLICQLVIETHPSESPLSKQVEPVVLIGNYIVSFDLLLFFTRIICLLLDLQ
jgi:hypothetical protein